MTPNDVGPCRPLPAASAAHFGIDVVDRTHPESLEAAGNPRYRERCLMPIEAEALLARGNRACDFWTVWAAKEAAHKASRKPETKFVPRRYLVDLRRLCVEGPGGCLRFAFRRSREFICVVAGFQAVCGSDTPLPCGGGPPGLPLTICGGLLAGIGDAGLPLLPPADSHLARDLARTCVERLLPGTAISVTPLGVLPWLRLAGDPPLEIPLCVAHHGRFVAWCLPIAGIWPRLGISGAISPRLPTTGHEGPYASLAGFRGIGPPLAHPGILQVIS